MTQVLQAPARARAAKFPNWRFVLALGLGFYLLNLLAVLHHVMWRDEWQVWLVSLQSPSQILHYLRQAAGHPPAWFYLAWLVNRLPGYPDALKIVHVLISTGAVLVLAAFAPLPRWQKALYALGYFPLYEYGTIMRDYALSVLLFYVAVALLVRRPRRPLAMGFVLALLAQVTVYGALLAVVLWITWLLNSRIRPADAGKVSNGAVAYGIGLTLLSILAAFWICRPSDLSNPETADLRQPLGNRLIDSVGAVWRADIPIPHDGLWNSNLLDFHPAAMAILGGAMILLIVWLLWPVPESLVLFLAGTAVLAAFNAYISVLQLRHQGYYFLLLVACCWVFYARPAAIASWRKHAMAGFMLVILLVQAVVGVMAVARERRTPFSGSLEAAQIIRDQFPADTVVVADMDYGACPVSGYLGRPIYIASRQEYCTYTIYDRRRLTQMLSPRSLHEVLGNVLSQTHQPVALLLDYPLEIRAPGVELVAKLTNAQVVEERYYIYRVRPAGFE